MASLISFFELDNYKGWIVLGTFLLTLLGSLGFGFHQSQEVIRVQTNCSHCEPTDLGFVCLCDTDPTHAADNAP